MTGPSLAEVGQDITEEEAALQRAFPEVESGLRPFGSRILVQFRTPKTRTEGGIYIPDDARETEKWNTQVSKVIALGPVAFSNRDTLQPWLEGPWCQPGAFVRVPKYGGDRWEVAGPDSQDPALIALFNDLDIIGEVTCNPLDVIAFL